MEVAIFCKRPRILKYGSANQNTLVLPVGWSKIVGISELAMVEIDSKYNGLTISVDPKAFKGIENEVKPVSRRQVEIEQEKINAQIAEELGTDEVELTDEEQAESDKLAAEKIEADKAEKNLAEAKKALEGKRIDLDTAGEYYNKLSEELAKFSE